VAYVQGLIGISENKCFGPKTQEAIQYFQHLYGIKPPAGMAGWVGATTLQWLERIAHVSPYDAKFQKQTCANTLAQLRSNGIIRPWCCGDSVTIVQRALKVTEHCFGPKTREAVVEFQKKYKLRPPIGSEGFVGSTTLPVMEKNIPNFG